MKQILLMIAVVGCGKKESVQPSAELKLWEFETGGAVISSPAIGSDGTVYVGSNDEKLYAIKTDSNWDSVEKSGMCFGNRTQRSFPP